jgi:hypothetical protein
VLRGDYQDADNGAVPARHFAVGKIRSGVGELRKAWLINRWLEVFGSKFNRNKSLNQWQTSLQFLRRETV